MASNIAKAVFPALHHLVLRSSLPGGKTPEEYAAEGRYNYVPSFTAAVVFVVIYFILILINCFQFYWHRSWFWWPMLLAVSSMFLFSLTPFSFLSTAQLPLNSR